MPLREYFCEDCGLLDSKLVSGWDAPKVQVCRSCTKRTAKLKFSSFAVVSPADATKAPTPNADVVIGQSAEKMWQVYDSFKKAKKVAVTAAKEIGTGITVDVAKGCTRPMTQKEMSERKQGYKMLGDLQRQQMQLKPKKHR